MADKAQAPRSENLEKPKKCRVVSESESFWHPKAVDQIWFCQGVTPGFEWDLLKCENQVGDRPPEQGRTIKS